MNEIVSKKKYSEPEVEVLYTVEEDILNGSFEIDNSDKDWSEWV